MEALITIENCSAVPMHPGCLPDNSEDPVLALSPRRVRGSFFSQHDQGALAEIRTI
jgi:hypothetical protein